MEKESDGDVRIGGINIVSCHHVRVHCTEEHSSKREGEWPYGGGL